jgi:Tol biopolymer transport system component
VSTPEHPLALVGGARLGPYEILGLIGAGGMGEVYRAKDIRLDRTVAIKVLPSEISSDPVRRARFEREAKTIATLSHPHICTLYDVGEYSGSLFLVMEHLDGETLAARVAKGPLSLNHTLTIAGEICDALAAAHRHGIVHRDLKPSNVMLTRSGVKLLDFGLAKLTGHGEQAAGAQLASLATRSTPLTAEGMIAGTLQYMAPEQLEGKPADARTDLWAVGTIVFEMMTAKRAFEGTSAVSVMAAILEREPPPIATLQQLTPPALDRIVGHCLAKSPDDRPDTAHDLANDLRLIREISGSAALPAAQAPTHRRILRSAPMVLVSALLGAMVASWAWTRVRPPVPSPTVFRTWLDVRPAEELSGANAGDAARSWAPTPAGSHTAFAWTPDGRALVFAGRVAGTQQLFVRALDRDEARPLAGTEGAQEPAVSPDGQWVAFWAYEKLKKVALGGGPVVELASGVTLPPMGLSWDGTGNVYFGRVGDRRIWKVSSDGALTAVTKSGETDWVEILPSVLPGGQALLFTSRKRDWSWGDDEIVAQRLATGDRKVLLHDADDVRYVGNEYLVFLRRGALFAVAFDPERLEIRGTPVAILDGVIQALTADGSADVTGAGQFAVAPTGTLAWVPGPVVPYHNNALVSVDRQGRVAQLPAPEKSYVPSIRRAPGGQQLATGIRDLTEVGLWTYDFARSTITPLARGGEVYSPIWTPDGQRLVFDWIDHGHSSLVWQRADGTTPPEVIRGVPGDATPSSWTPDGRHLVVVTYGNDLAIVTIDDGRASVQPLAQTPYVESGPEFSPDGRWLAYASDLSGQNEVYIQPYPGPGSRMQVSDAGGESPAWAPNGRELFFVGPPNAAGKRHMIVAPIERGSRARVSRAQALFEFDPSELGFACLQIRCYDVAPDGQRFYVTMPSKAQPKTLVTHVNLVQNWMEELKARVPVK